MVSRGAEGERSCVAASKTSSRVLGFNEFVLATLMTLGFLALNGYGLAAAFFVWYAALYVLRT
jgi:hypothetical protein